MKKIQKKLNIIIVLIALVAKATKMNKDRWAIK